jgi:hypothetical protein
MYSVSSISASGLQYVQCLHHQLIRTTVIGTKPCSLRCALQAIDAY